MRKIVTVAIREYRAAVLTKAFLIGLALMPIMMGGSIFIQIVFKDVKSLKDKTFVVIDRTSGGLIYTALNEVMKKRNEEGIFDKNTHQQKEPKFMLERISPSPNVLQQRFELAERVRHQEIFGFLDIGSKVFEIPNVNDKITMEAYAVEMGANVGDSRQDRNRETAKKLPEEMTIRYYSNSPTYNDFHAWAESVINLIIRAERALGAGLSDKDKLAAILLAVPLTNRELPRINRVTGELEDGKDVNFFVSLFVPFGIIMVMFMIIMVGATPLMQGVVEEKMQKIAEVLLASAKPFELMAGKLLGGVAVSLTLGTVYLSGGLLGAWYYGFTDYLSLTVVLWFLLFLVLAVLMFGSLFVAVGAACSDLKETQSLLLPVMLLAVFPMFFLTKIIQEPDGALATGLSFFPFATPSLMVARIAIPPGVQNWWQPYLGVAGVLLTTTFCVWVAGRIFRVGLLMQGKGASFSEIVKWAWKG